MTDRYTSSDAAADAAFAFVSAQSGIAVQHIERVNCWLQIDAYASAGATYTVRRCDPAIDADAAVIVYHHPDCVNDGFETMIFVSEDFTNGSFITWEN